MILFCDYRKNYYFYIMFQKAFLEKIKEELSVNTSLNEEIATVLQISYDAAHRRTSLKSKFSLEESVVLANYFKISLDTLFGEAKSGFLSVEKTKQINNEEDLQEYFENLYKSFTSLLGEKDCQIYYSAKDIPVFYTLKDNRLSHFKIYVWLKLLDKTYRNKNFDQFQPKLSTLQSARKLSEVYQNIPTIEVWDTTTINSTLKQIHFYYKAGQLSMKTALELCELLKILLNEISLKVVSKKYQFQLYYNELLLMSNNVLIETPQKKALYVPHAMLSYYLTNDKLTCNQAKQNFSRQLKHSKLLNTSGEKEQNQFYNRMLQKVTALMQLISAENILDFE